MGNDISAILLAAGLSSRMGQPKLLLPWGGTTVLGRVISTFAAAGIQEIIVVTGAAREQLEGQVSEFGKIYPVRSAFNPEYALSGMMGSIQAGLAALGSRASAALIGLGDQPQVQEKTVRDICSTFNKSGLQLVIPGFQNRRGHPWLIARTLWGVIQHLPLSTTPREFLNSYSGQVGYVAADESILQDMDTPEEYSRQRPESPL